MKDFRREDTEGFRRFVRIFFGVFSVVTILVGLGVFVDGCTRDVMRDQDKDETLMFIGGLITVFGPLFLRILYRLVLVPFDILDILKSSIRNNDGEK